MREKVCTGGVVAVPRGAGSFGWSVDSHFASLTVFFKQWKPLFAVLSVPYVGRWCTFANRD